MGKWVETEGLIQTKKYSTCYPHEKKKLKPTSKNRYNKDIRHYSWAHNYNCDEIGNWNNSAQEKERKNTHPFRNKTKNLITL